MVGRTARLLRNRSLVAAHGTFVGMTGHPATFTKKSTRTFSAEHGAFSGMVGYPASFTKSKGNWSAETPALPSVWTKEEPPS